MLIFNFLVSTFGCIVSSGNCCNKSVAVPLHSGCSSDTTFAIASSTGSSGSFHNSVSAFVSSHKHNSRLKLSNNLVKHQNIPLVQHHLFVTLFLYLLIFSGFICIIKRQSLTKLLTASITHRNPPIDALIKKGRTMARRQSSPLSSAMVIHALNQQHYDKTFP